MLCIVPGRRRPGPARYVHNHTTGHPLVHRPPATPAATRAVFAAPRHDGRVTTIGAVFPPSFPPERLRSVVQAADAAGLDELWLWEDCFREGGMSSAAAALAWTANLRVGVGVFPVPLRNPALAAMEIATLSRMFGDRAIVGLGHGVQDWMAQVGGRSESPMTLLREYVSAVRALLGGERLSVEGR